jgi:hypothetical protein
MLHLGRMCSKFWWTGHSFVFLISLLNLGKVNKVFLIRWGFLLLFIWGSWWRWFRFFILCFHLILTLHKLTQHSSIRISRNFNFNITQDQINMFFFIGSRFKLLTIFPEWFRMQYWREKFEWLFKRYIVYQERKETNDFALEIGKTWTFKSRWQKKRTGLTFMIYENRNNKSIFEKGVVISNHISFLFINKYHWFLLIKTYYFVI